ncbi:DUF1403 family protein [Arvimicrobium flavum]|uniref:DUF1403 family protein n=1 Tax=Arvimicrobium flavum TaxID=3393320 RepID=UPI00398CDF59
MIRRPKSLANALYPLAGAPAPGVSVPAWLRLAPPDPQRLAAQAIEDVAAGFGAAVGALDAVVRRYEPWAGAWRQRLALTAAGVTARQAGRAEDEAALRDAVLLTRPGDEVGPAGRMLLAWRRLAISPPDKLLGEASLAALLHDLGLAHDDEAVSDLADDLRRFAAAPGMVGMLAGAFASVERRGLPRVVGAWVADALLAQRLSWAQATPLAGLESALGAGAVRPRRAAAGAAVSAMETEAERAKGLLAAQARAALRALDLSAELGRRAEKLLAVAPKLRAKAADAVVDKILCGDAIVASEMIAGISDRGLRRLFDRLVSLSAVRELSGRTTFRIYGL